MKKLLDILRRIKRKIFASQEMKWSDLIDDEYVEHLMFVVGGFIVNSNLRAFECCVKNMPDKGAVVEIGSFLGKSTNLIAYAMIKYRRDNLFYSCDPWVFAGRDKPKAGYFSTNTTEYRDWVMQLFKMNTSLFSKGHEPFTIEAFSSQFFDLWSKEARVKDVWNRDAVLGGPISFAFVDGAHTYNEVKSDFINIDKYLLKGGYIFFDDSSDTDVYKDIQRVVAEVKASGSYEVALKTPNYCFKKK